MKVFATPAYLHLKLYIAGDTRESRKTIENVKKLCQRFAKGKCKVDVVDIKKDPKVAIRDQIFAIPTLVNVLPDSDHRFIGNLASPENIIKLFQQD